MRQWEALVAARALDSTCFIAAVDAARPGGPAKAGKPEGPVGVGHSILSSPDGDVIAKAGFAPQLLIADIDLDEVERIRKSIPVLEIRK